jgi:hypothetical protein
VIDADVYLDSIVHNIENFYMGIEELFKRIAVLQMKVFQKAPDGTAYSSKGWQGTYPAFDPLSLKMKQGYFLMSIENSDILYGIFIPSI